MPVAKGTLYANSLVFKVVEAVEVRGTATVDDLMPAFPDRTRSQLHAALANARDRRLLRIKVKGNGSHSASLWEPGSMVPSPLPEVKPSYPLSSVWDLGNPRPWRGQWPPLSEGRSFALLSAGDVEEETYAAV